MEHPLDRYADRGTPRGAEAVYEAALEQADGPDAYVQVRPESPRAPLVAVAAAALILVVALGVAALWPSEDAGSDIAAQPPTSDPGLAQALPPVGPDILRPEDLESAPGWTAIMLDAEANQVGYYRTAESRSDSPVEVFALPADGPVIGYSVSWVGFVDISSIRSPGFSLDQFARDRFDAETYAAAIAEAGPLDKADEELKRVVAEADDQ